MSKLDDLIRNKAVHDFKDINESKDLAFKRQIKDLITELMDETVGLKDTNSDAELELRRKVAEL